MGQSQPASAPASAPASTFERKLDELCCKIDSLEGLIKAFKQFQHEQKKP